MKILRFTAALALPLVAGAQDTTARNQDQTLMQRLGLHGMHVSMGGGSSPYMGTTTTGASTGEFRFGITFRRWPSWTLAVAASEVGERDTTGYAVANSSGYHPRLAAVSSGVELQHRWSSSSLFHPVAAVGAGQITNSYNYYFYPTSGGSVYNREQVTDVPYATISGGGELNVSGWARILIAVGYRTAGSTRIAYGVGNNSGATSAVLVELGKF